MIDKDIEKIDLKSILNDVKKNDSKESIEHDKRFLLHYIDELLSKKTKLLEDKENDHQIEINKLNKDINENLLELQRLHSLEDKLKEKKENELKENELKEETEIIKTLYFLKSRTEELMQTYKLTYEFDSNYEFYMNFIEKNNIKSIPTIRIHDNMFLKYDQDNPKKFYDKLNEIGENPNKWKDIIDKHDLEQLKTIKEKNTFILTFIKPNDFDIPLSIINKNEIIIIFKFPIPLNNDNPDLNDSEKRFCMIFNNIFKNSIYSKYNINGIVKFFWDIQLIDYGILFLKFNGSKK